MKTPAPRNRLHRPSCLARMGELRIGTDDGGFLVVTVQALGTWIISIGSELVIDARRET